MDRSHQSPSNNSSGFIYFNTTPNQEYHSESDTADFLAFSESPQQSPQPQKFRPAYYSSPQQKFHRGSPRNYPQNRRYQRRSGGNNWSTYSSNNSSFNHNISVGDYDEDSNITKFIHPSFLEDPWAKLEAQLKEKTQTEDPLPENRNT